MLVPDNINQCFQTNDNNGFDANPFNVCGEDVSESSVMWKCLETDIYPSSLVVLNKHTFQLQIGINLIGIDSWTSFCLGFGTITDTENCPSFIGPDGDLAAVSAYYDSENLDIIYAAAFNKAGFFYVYDIKSMELKISKKVGPWSFRGGGTWSLAIDQKNMIAVA